MKKILLLLCTLLGTVGAMATDVKIANTSSGLPTAAGFGTFYGQVFTTAAGSGLAGVTVTAASGVTIGEQQVNVADYGNCFKIVTAAAATNYQITLAAPAGYVITGYALDCSANTKNAVHTLTSEDGTVSVVASAPVYNNPTGPKAFVVNGLEAQSTYFTISTANQGNTLYLPTFTISVVQAGAQIVNVTYKLYESDGTTEVSGVASVVKEQEAGSDLDIPSALTSNTYYNYSTEGTIGNEDCTIKVIRTLKSEIVGSISNLSNAKAYSIVVPRGTYTVNNGQLANTVKSSYDINYFALIKYEDNYYMWSLEAGKFAAGSGATLSDTPAAITFNASTFPSFQIKSGTNTLNATSGFATGGGFDSWSAADDGNRCVIYEVEDFDPTNVLAALEEYFHPAAETMFNNAIAQLEAINFGTGLNQYSFTGDYAGYTSQAATIISGLKAQGYTNDNLAVAQALLANYAINLPAAGFYRIKGKTNGKYLAAGYASNDKYNMSEATDATTIFYFDGYQLVNLSSGMSNGVTASSWAWVLGENASTVVFEDGETNGGYLIHTANAYFFDGGTSADRGGAYDDRAQYRNWYLEEVTTLPVAISAAGYATLCAPVALTVPSVPSGVTANTAALNGNIIELTTVGETIPAGTPVILEGAEGSYDFAIDATNADPAIANALTGVYAAIVAPNNSYILQKQNDKVGFYQVDVTEATPKVPGFRAYIPAQGGEVKAFFFGEADGISSVENGQLTKDNEAIFNIAGQRVAKAQKGIYIMNGKKVLVK